MLMPNAVVFAYSSVGVECLSVLLRHGVNVSLVYTHEDDPNEEHWFKSVYDLAKSHNLNVRTDEPSFSVVEAAKPHVIFCIFYLTLRRSERSICTALYCRSIAEELA